MGIVPPKLLPRFPRARTSQDPKEDHSYPGNPTKIEGYEEVEEEEENSREAARQRWNKLKNNRYWFPIY